MHLRPATSEDLDTVITDTHTHLCDAVFDEDREQVLQRARAAGVGSIVLVGEGLQDARTNLELAKQYPVLKPAAGLYPGILDQEQADALVAFIRANQADLVAIGEVGLDYWIAKQPDEKEMQASIFRAFIDLSRETDMPLNIHSRSAGRKVVELLLAEGAQKVQLHAFDAKASAALPAVEAGYFFSIPPSIVRSRQKQKLVKALPLDAMLLETDSPVLGPDPKGRNEPANINLVVEAIAQIKNVSPGVVIEATAENTRKLYGDRIVG
jgi:TatD DNase family protein